MTDPESIILLTSGYDARTLDADKRRGGELHDRRRRRHADRAAGVAAAWSQGVHASAPDLDGSRQRDVLQRPALARGKILSTWPRRTSLQLPRTCRYDGRRYRLRPGRYR